MGSASDRIEVAVQFLEDGFEGPGYYVWEAEYPEDGCVAFFPKRPSAKKLREICSEYVEKK